MTRRWLGHCVGCNLEGVEVEPRRDHGERVLCDPCAARPTVKPRGAHTNGSRTAVGEAPLDRLTAALKLGDGLSVARAELHGRGTEARVVLVLDDGNVLDIERYGDVMKPGTLEAIVTCGTGRVVAYKKTEAQQVGSLIYQAGEYHEAATDRDEAHGWGVDFLRRAQEVEADMRDQAERWGAFSLLDGLDPMADAKMTCRAPASASTIIRDHDGSRWIVSAWFGAHVRHIAAGQVNLQRLPNLMSAVGWERRGQRGDVKATSPSDARTIRLRLYRVPANWEDRGTEVTTGPHDAEVPGPQVPTGPYPPTRVHTRARVGGDPWGPAEKKRTSPAALPPADLVLVDSNSSVAVGGTAR